jgi:hypothetical protein
MHTTSIYALNRFVQNMFFRGHGRFVGPVFGRDCLFVVVQSVVFEVTIVEICVSEEAIVQRNFSSAALLNSQTNTHVTLPPR